MASQVRAVDRGYHLVRIVLATVLLAASALKCQQLATEPIIGAGLLESRWLLVITVEFELFFGIWLLANTLQKPAWLAAVVCFSLFTCVSVCKALSGYATCGCFGRVPVNPWYTSVLDLAIVISLLHWPPRESFFTVRRATVVLAFWIVLGLPAAYAMGSYVDTTLSELGEVVGDGKVIVLEPDRWIGKQLPLLNYIDVGSKLGEGEWLVLLYHYDCPNCQAAIAELTKKKRSRLVCVEVPPYRKDKNLPAACMAAKLRADYDWFVSTPVVIRVADGLVTEVSEKF